MKIENSFPPIWDKIIAAGMNPDPANVVVTYGDTIYNPSGQALPTHLIEHEETHRDQQGNDPDGWWGRYLVDPYFRTEQEAEAYGNQYVFICDKVKDRNHRARILNELASKLSGPTYGKVLSHVAALALIKKKAGK